MTLHTFYQYQGRYREEIGAFTSAVTAVSTLPASPNRDRDLAMLLTCAGWLHMRLGQLDEATQKQQKALALYRRLDRLPPPGAGTDPLNALSLLAVVRGDAAQGMAYGEQAWQRAAARDDKQNMAYAGYGRVSAALAQGEYETALHIAQETAGVAREAGNRWFLAYIYNQLGQANEALKRHDAAADYYRAAYNIRETFDDPEGMALALNHLGDIAAGNDAPQEAYDLYRRSLSLYQELGDRGGLITTLHRLGSAAHRLGNAAEANEYFQRALQLAADVELAPLTLALLADVGALLAETKAAARGVATLAYVAGHPAAEEATQARTLRRLQQHAPDAETEMAHVCQHDLGTMVEMALLALTAVAAADESPAAERDTGETAVQNLVEPLSERELEVMQLIADGLKNKEIADRLVVALSTVKSHINNIYGKLGVSNRVQAVARAHEFGLLKK